MRSSWRGGWIVTQLGHGPATEKARRKAMVKTQQTNHDKRVKGNKFLDIPPLKGLLGQV